MVLTAVCLACSLAFYFCKAPTVSAHYKIEGWPIKKSWGAMRGNYIDPQTRELRFIFEDPAGTVRIVNINSESKTAVPVVEMRRE
jgi:hypothetical protein